MSINDLKKEKEAMREEVSRKLAQGQSLKEHIRENSIFTREAIKQSKMTMIIDGEKIVIYPDCADEEDKKQP